MSKNVVRLGDPTSHGGKVITASSTSLVDGKAIALIGDLVSCPKPGHGVNKIITGSESCFSDGKAIVVEDCICECGCKVISTINTIIMG